MPDFSDEFLAGQKACKEGKPCPSNASSDFVRGYAAQYEYEEIKAYQDRLNGVDK